MAARRSPSVRCTVCSSWRRVVIRWRCCQCQSFQSVSGTPFQMLRGPGGKRAVTCRTGRGASAASGSIWTGERSGSAGFARGDGARESSSPVNTGRVDMSFVRSIGASAPPGSLLTLRGRSDRAPGQAATLPRGTDGARQFQQAAGRPARFDFRDRGRYFRAFFSPGAEGAACRPRPCEPVGWRELFPHVTEADWRDWRWQQRHALRSPEAVAALVDLTSAERRGLELTARAVVHRYPDRALFLATDTCAVYRRHCTRRRITGGQEGAFDRAAAEEGLAYVREHREIRDVIVSGGDPLVLGDDRLGWLLRALREIPHVEILRLATRAPVTCPMRVDDALASLLRSVKPIFVVTHFNHLKECTPEAQEACERLVDHGVPVENQSVLLRRVNSSARNIGGLNRRLLSWRVRPYYLHQGDVVEGTAHLRTPLACGVQILEQLRGHTSGLAVPHLAVDLPGGGGKVTLQPEYRVGAPFDSGARGAPTLRANGCESAQPERSAAESKGERAPGSATTAASDTSIGSRPRRTAAVP